MSESGEDIDPVESLKAIVSELECLRREKVASDQRERVCHSWIKHAIGVFGNGSRLTRTAEECDVLRDDERALSFGACEVEILP